jgi:hypothetical protein
MFENRFEVWLQQIVKDLRSPCPKKVRRGT